MSDSSDPEEINEAQAALEALQAQLDELDRLARHPPPPESEESEPGPQPVSVPKPEPARSPAPKQVVAPVLPTAPVSVEEDRGRQVTVALLLAGALMAVLFGSKHLADQIAAGPVAGPVADSAGPAEGIEAPPPEGIPPAVEGTRPFVAVDRVPEPPRPVARAPVGFKEWIELEEHQVDLVFQAWRVGRVEQAGNSVFDSDYILLDLRVRNNSSEPVAVHRLFSDLEMQDGEGRTLPNLTGQRPRLTAGQVKQLEPGRNEHLRFVFRAPRGTKGLHLLIPGDPPRRLDFVARARSSQDAVFDSRP